MMDKHSDAPVAIITGCSVNIGRATAILLAKRGWRVFATARRLETLTNLASDRLTPLHLDVTSNTSIKAAVERVLAQAGRIDALVNVAGALEVGPLEQAASEEIYRQFETSTFGPLRLAQRVLPTMRAQGSGRIVNITSINGKIAIPFVGLYNGSKFALEAMSDTLRLETRPFGIHVIIIEPGITGNMNPAAVQRVHHCATDSASPYQRFFKGLERFVTNPKSKSSPPKVVSSAIYHALTTPHPRARYAATPDARLALAVLPRLPDWMLDMLWSRLLGLR